MTKMFTTPDGKRFKTWSPIFGCHYSCYNGGCWAKRMALRLRAMGQEKYKFGFEPHFAFDEYSFKKKKFKAGEIVFVSSMGDAFAPWVSFDAIRVVLSVIEENPQTDFLLQTKNPRRFVSIAKTGFLPTNVYLGTTIETDTYPNSTHGFSKADAPDLRYRAMLADELSPWRKFISIEPIIDFNLDTLVSWAKEIAPQIVEIGADSLRNSLPEPSWGKVVALKTELKKFVPVVIEKEGLERLREWKT